MNVMQIAVGAGVVSLLGALLFVWGLRGRLLDDHRLCRRCGYDLTGADATTCPECGVDLNRRRAVRVGTRRRRPRAIVFGTLMLLIGALGGGIIGLAAARGVDFNRHKPVWWLRAEFVGSGNDADAAEVELHRRIAAGEIDDGTLRDLFADVLEIQGDDGRGWNGTWGDLIGDAWEAGVIDDAMFRRYVEQAMALDLQVPRAVRPGQSFSVRLELKPQRAGTVARYVLHVEASGEVDEGEMPFRGLRVASGVVGEGATSAYGKFMTPDLPVGRRTIDVRMTYRLAANPNDRRSTSGFADMRPVLEWTVSSVRHLDVVEPGTPLGEPIDEPSHAAAIERAITIDRCRFGPREFDPDSGPKPQVTFEIADVLPVPVLFDVFWRVGSEEWLVSKFSMAPGDTRQRSMRYPSIADIELPDECAAVDVVLRTNLDNTLYVDDIPRAWVGEIVYRDVPLERTGGAP